MHLTRIMKLETAILLTVFILIIVTFAPIVIARMQRAPVKETYSPTTINAITVLKKIIHQTPDAAEYTDEEVATYLGGASSRSVILEVVESTMQLAVANITSNKVRFVGDGSYDVVKTGGLIHDEFELHPVDTGTSGVLIYKGVDALKFLQARSKVLNKLSAFRYIRVRNPNDTMRSHDLSQATVPVVPEICKHAPLQALSLTFYTGATGTGGVSVFVIPRKNNLPPAAFHVRFYGKDVLIKYHVLKAAVGKEPNAIVTMSAAATSRSEGEIFLMDARTGTDNVKVYAELTKGHVRLCTEELSRKRSYYLKLPLMFSEDGIFLSDSIDPPSVFTRTYDVEQPMILPFAIGDMGAFDRVQYTVAKHEIKQLEYKPTGTPEPLKPIEKGVLSASFVPQYGKLEDVFNGGMARSHPGLYNQNGGYIGHKETRTKSGAVIRGEWIQYDISKPAGFHKLKYKVRDADIPKRLVVLGSNNDGWTQIAVQNGVPLMWSEVAIPLTGYYRQYRVVVTDTVDKVKIIAKEGQNFDFVGNVKYGTNNKWTTKNSEGSGQCTNGWFGSDPVPGSYKVCEADNGIQQQGTVFMTNMSFV